MLYPCVAVLLPACVLSPCRAAAALCAFPLAALCPSCSCRPSSCCALLCHLPAPPCSLRLLPQGRSLTHTPTPPQANAGRCAGPQGSPSVASLVSISDSEPNDAVFSD